MKAVRVVGLGEAAGVNPPRAELAAIPVPVRNSDQEVRVRVLCAGLDGTDREILSEKYGVPPEGSDAITIGHESLGVVDEADPETGFFPGDLVTVLVRRPCNQSSCVNCRNGRQDFCETGEYTERGIKGADGFMSEYYVEDARYLVRIPSHCLDLGVLVEPQSIVEKVWDEVQRIQQRLVWQPRTALVLGSGPLGLLAVFTCRSLGLHTLVWSKSGADSLSAELVRASGAVYVTASSGESGGNEEPLTDWVKREGLEPDIIFECTGYSPLAFDAMAALKPNGVLALLGVTPGNRSIKISSDLLNREIVLENKCILGSVNAARKDFETGIYRLQRIEEQFPGLLHRLMSDRLTIDEVPGVDFDKLKLKAVVDVVPQQEWKRLARLDKQEVAYSFSV